MVDRIRRRVLRWGMSAHAPAPVRRQLRSIQLERVRATLSPAQVERGDIVTMWRKVARIASSLPAGTSIAPVKPITTW